MGIFSKRTSLSANFLIFVLLSFGAILALSMWLWLQLYNEELEKKHAQLADESARIQSVFSDTMDYITQYTNFIGEKIVQHDNTRDLRYIAGLISGSADTISSENKFYFTTTFDWVTPDKMLRVSNKVGVLPVPFDMTERDYLQRTPLYPWTLQLSKPRLGGLSKQWIVPAGMGITDDSGRFLGSITLGFSLKGLEQRINQTLGHTDIHYLLLTDDFKPVLDSSRDNAIGPDPAFSASRLDTKTADAAGYLQRPFAYNGAVYSHVRKLPGYPYVILSGYPATMAQSLFNELVVSRSLGLFGMLCATLGIFYWMRRRLIQPVLLLAQAADRIRKGKQVSFAESPIHEINVLGSELLKISEYIQKEHRIHNELNQKTMLLEAANQEALEARDSAIKANHAKSEFLANMSHELRTPLNAIIGLTNVMLLRKLTPERQKEYLETMQMSSQTLLDLINNLLDIAKIESENIQLEQLNFNLNDVLTEVTRMLSVRAYEKNIRLTSHYDSHLPQHIIGDPTRVKQVLINLLSNAIKFTEHGSVTVNLRPVLKNNKKMLAIEVIDTGIGIASQKLETIFDKFSQADSSITRRYGGTGLGLALTKTLVELMGGTILVSSEAGLGSTFTACIPLLAAPSQPVNVNEKITEMPTPDMDKTAPLVLLVDDQRPNIMVTSNLLETLGCRYEVAHHGRDAIERVKATVFDLILMDIQMPDMDGFQTTQIIREYEKQQGRMPLPIVGLTAYALSGDKEKCLKAGMNDYLAKPIDLEKFNEVVMHFLRHKFAAPPIYSENDAFSKKIH